MEIFWFYFLSPLFFALWDWYTIEKLREEPPHSIMFIIRAAIGVSFAFILIYFEGYIWYWVIPFILFAFWGPFNTFLNLFRDKDIFHMGQNDIDKFLVKIPGYWYWLFLLAVMATGMMYFYGKCSYYEIVNRICI